MNTTAGGGQRKEGEPFISPSFQMPAEMPGPAQQIQKPRSKGCSVSSTSQANLQSVISGVRCLSFK